MNRGVQSQAHVGQWVAARAGGLGHERQMAAPILRGRWVLPSDLTAASLARGHVVDACRGLSTEKVDVARLLVTELVANAVLHGGGIVLLVVARTGEGVRIYVDDENPEPPVVIEPRSLMENGAGMRLVAALADNWGVAPRGNGQAGKRVWFSLL